MEITKSINSGKMYWGEGALPVGAEIVGTVKRPNELIAGALILLSNGNHVQGNAGTIRTLAPHEVKDALEAYTFGRPPIYSEAMRQTAIFLPEHMITWLKAQPGGMSETVRKLVQAAMDQAERNII